MANRELVNEFWVAMQDNDWQHAASYLVPGCVIDWPCSGERIVGRSDYATVQARGEPVIGETGKATQTRAPCSGQQVPNVGPQAFRTYGRDAPYLVLIDIG